MDDRHLELTKDLPSGLGNRLYIQILSPIEEHEYQLQILRKSYLSMSDNEKKWEEQFAEKGLQGQENLDVFFENEVAP